VANVHAQSARLPTALDHCAGASPKRHTRKWKPWPQFSSLSHMQLRTMRRSSVVNVVSHSRMASVLQVRFCHRPHSGQLQLRPIITTSIEPSAPAGCSGRLSSKRLAARALHYLLGGHSKEGRAGDRRRRSRASNSRLTRAFHIEARLESCADRDIYCVELRIDSVMSFGRVLIVIDKRAGGPRDGALSTTPSSGLRVAHRGTVTPSSSAASGRNTIARSSSTATHREPSGSCSSTRSACIIYA